MDQKLRVGVIFGGRSGEHEVSIASAASVLNAIDTSKYEVVPIGITREGRWVESAGAIAALGAGAAALPSPDDSDGAELDPLPAILPSPGEHARVVVLPLLHGPMGEDGTVQGLLELAGVPFSNFIANRSANSQAAAYSLVLRGYVRTWLNQISSEYDRVGLIERLTDRAAA